MFSLESPHRVHTIYHFQYEKENHPILPQICSYRIFFLRTQERVRNSHGKRVSSVRATEVLLYMQKCYHFWQKNCEEISAKVSYNFSGKQKCQIDFVSIVNLNKPLTNDFFNPLKPYVFFHSYHLDESSLAFRGFRLILSQLF